MQCNAMQYNYNIIKNKKFDLCNCWTSLAWEGRQKLGKAY
jgi:hypothetical protein